MILVTFSKVKHFDLKKSLLKYWGYLLKWFVLHVLMITIYAAFVLRWKIKYYSFFYKIFNLVIIMRVNKRSKIIQINRRRLVSFGKYIFMKQQENIGYTLCQLISSIVELQKKISFLTTLKSEKMRSNNLCQ